MALATGGTAGGDTNTKSRPNSWALRRAIAVGMTSAVPSGKTARTSLTRMDSLTFSRRLGLRGGKFLGGSIKDSFRLHTTVAETESPREGHQKRGKRGSRLAACRPNASGRTGVNIRDTGCAEPLL